MSTQDEVEALHERVAQFVTSYLRSDANPAIHARALVHCKTGITHLVVPLTAVNGLDLTLVLAQTLKETFPPDAHIRTRPTPDASQIVYELVIPLTAGMTGRHRSKHRGGGGGDHAAAASPAPGLMENPAVLGMLFLVLLMAVAAGWLFLDKV